MEDQSSKTVADLPPGFRFHPTDEEIITHYLTPKVLNSDFSAAAIGEVDINKCEPWDMPKKAKLGEKVWYFFWQRDKKYPTGMRTNRATEAGYWKATGKDKAIYKEKGCLVGMKKTLVFYKGRAPKGQKTNWVMHEYRLEGNFSYYSLPKTTKDEWVVSRVLHKNLVIKKSPIHDLSRVNSFVTLDDYLDCDSLPPLPDSTGGPTSSEIKAGLTLSRSYDVNCFNNNIAVAAVAPNNQNLVQSSSTSYQLIQHQNSPLTYQNSNDLHGTYLDHKISNVRFKSECEVEQFSPQNSLLTYQNPGDLPDYSHRKIPLPNPSLIKLNQPCKVEQFSSNNQSMVLSQDTGLSNDVNTTEISSVALTPDMGSNYKVYEDCLQGPLMGTMGDYLDCFNWDYL